MNLKMKIILLSVVALLLLSGSALATWLLQIEDGQSTTITSIEGGTISFSSNWDDLFLDTTTGAASDNTTAVINNSDGLLEMIVLVSEAREDNVSDGCTDYVNDVFAVYRIAGVQVFSGSLINISGGLSDLNVVVSAAAHSCPQVFRTNVTLTET